MYAQARKYFLEGSMLDTEVFPEWYSVMQFAPSDQGRPNALANIKNFDADTEETFLNFSGTKATAQKTDVLVTLGLLKIQKERPQWGNRAYVTPYKPSNEVERQVYLQGSKVSMLTNKRLVEISEMRPIDKLFNILVNISESNK